MKIIFFGTGKFGISSLEKLLSSRHKVVAVVTQPDRKRGRGWKEQPMPVKSYLTEHKSEIDIYQPENAREPSFVESLRGKADVFVVIDYGQFLSKELLSVPEKYCVNLHPSLLPKYRGAAPVNWAILEGENITGNTVFKMNERMDAGDIILQKEEDIIPEEDSLSLSVRLSSSGADLLIKSLDIIEKGEEVFTPQMDAEATFAPKLKKEMGEIDWTDDAKKIIRKIKAFNPWPGAFTYLEDKTLKVIDAEYSETSQGTPGNISSLSPLTITAVEGSVILKTVQLEGKKAMRSTEFLRGCRIEKGRSLGKQG